MTRRQRLAISASGTPSAPITIRADVPPGQAGASVNFNSASGSGFLVSGVHDVVISGFTAWGAAGNPAIEIDSSADITVDGGSAHGGPQSAAGAIHVTGTSSGITVSRVSVTGAQGPGVQVDAGVTGAVVTGSTIAGLAPGPAVLATDSPGIEVTGNTLISHCSTIVALAGASAGATVENNIIEAVTGNANPPCAGTVPAGISVSADSAAGTTADYNLTDPASGAPVYDWAGTSYADLADFTAATGQGSHDLAASPGLGTESGGDDPWFPLTASSPAVDSADASAPGELASDQLGNARAADPDVPDTGTGPGYYDRGAVELEDGVRYGGLTVSRDPALGALAVTATAPITTPWVTNGPLGTDSFIFSGSIFPVITSTGSAGLVLPGTGLSSVSVEQQVPGFSEASSSTFVVVGAKYTPITPTRIVDTRGGPGIDEAGPIPAHSTLTLGLNGIGPADGGPSAAVLNVTVTQPSAAGWVSVHAPTGNAPPPATSNINFAARQTVSNLVTVEPVDGLLVIQNGSGGTVNVVVDADGFYSVTGDGFAPLAPVRVLDTRAGTGAPARPVAAHGRLVLDLAGKVPAGASAAVLNVTVTQPQAAGFLTAFGDGQNVPLASSINFARGQACRLVP